MNMLNVLLCSLYCLSSVSELLAVSPYTSDEEENVSGSGIFVEPNGGSVIYKRLDIKFSTKHEFQNPPKSKDFIAEVVEEVAYALNKNGGPLPGVEHRPAILDKEDFKVIHADSMRSKRDTDSGTGRGGNGSRNVVRIKGVIKVPQSVQTDRYMERMERTQFFNTIKCTKEDPTPLVFTEQSLMDFEQSRLPIRTVEGIEKNDPNNERGQGTNGDGGVIYNENRPELDVRYKPLPDEFLRDPATLAALIAGALAGLLCTVLCTIFVVYRMRKKDEGSYALDEPKNTYKYKHEMYIASATKEFFA